jgi:hypothetical protein
MSASKQDEGNDTCVKRNLGFPEYGGKERKICSGIMPLCGLWIGLRVMS